jgi:hypothetical protein
MKPSKGADGEKKGYDQIYANIKKNVPGAKIGHLFEAENEMGKAGRL